MKDAYQIELKNLKDQTLSIHSQLKAKDKLVRKLYSILHSQEFKMSTQDYSVFVEFDRDPKINISELI